MEWITPEMIEVLKLFAAVIIAALPGIYALRQQQLKNRVEQDKSEAEASEIITRSASNVVTQYKEITDIYKRQIVEFQAMLTAYKKESDELQKTLDELRLSYTQQTDTLLNRMARLETIIKVLVDQLQAAGLKPNADLDDILNGKKEK